MQLGSYVSVRLGPTGDEAPESPCPSSIGPKIPRKTIRILQKSIPGIPRILGLGSRMRDPYVYVVCWAPISSPSKRGLMFELFSTLGLRFQIAQSRSIYIHWAPKLVLFLLYYIYIYGALGRGSFFSVGPAARIGQPRGLGNRFLKEHTNHLAVSTNSGCVSL